MRVNVGPLLSHYLCHSSGVVVELTLITLSVTVLSVCLNINLELTRPGTISAILTINYYSPAVVLSFKTFEVCRHSRTELIVCLDMGRKQISVSIMRIIQSWTASKPISLDLSIWKSPKKSISMFILERMWLQSSLIFIISRSRAGYNFSRKSSLEIKARIPFCATLDFYTVTLKASYTFWASCAFLRSRILCKVSNSASSFSKNRSL